LPKKLLVHMPDVVTDFCTQRVSAPYRTVFVPVKLNDFPSEATVVQLWADAWPAKAARPAMARATIASRLDRGRARTHDESVGHDMGESS
jgi:hypothetical protein